MEITQDKLDNREANFEKKDEKLRENRGKCDRYRPKGECTALYFKQWDVTGHRAEGKKYVRDPRRLPEGAQPPRVPILVDTDS